MSFHIPGLRVYRHEGVVTQGPPEMPPTRYVFHSPDLEQWAAGADYVRDRVSASAASTREHMGWLRGACSQSEQRKQTQDQCYQERCRTLERALDDEEARQSEDQRRASALQELVAREENEVNRLELTIAEKESRLRGQEAEAQALRDILRRLSAVVELLQKLRQENHSLSGGGTSVVHESWSQTGRSLDSRPISPRSMGGAPQ